MTALRGGRSDVKKIMEAYKGKVRLVIKNYPYKYRDYARMAAEASLAAKEQGSTGDARYPDQTFPKLDRASLIGYATELGWM